MKFGCFSGLFRPLSALSSRFLLSIAHYCLPGASCSSTVSYYSQMADPVVIPAKSQHTATVIFLHGLGDSGHGWSSVFEDEIRHDHIKYICPNAPSRPVTLNMGMRMPAWFDLYGLTPDAQEDEEGIALSTSIIHSMIDAEINAGISADRILLGGFSMGGALALYAGLTYYKPLAGILGLSSFLIQRSKIPGNHTANKQVNILMGHGGQDFLVPLSFGQMTETYIKAFNPNIQIKIYPRMAHSSCPEELQDAKNFIAQRLPVV